MHDLPSTKNIKLAIFAIFFSLTAFAISFNVIPPLVTTIADDIGVHYENFGYLIMLHAVFFAVAGLVGGWLNDRFGVSNRALVIFGLFSMAATLAVGAVFSNMSSFLIWAVPLGFGGGLTEIFGSVMISEFEKPKSSKLINLSQVFYCLGAIIAPQVAALLLGWQVSWRIAFVIFSIVVFAAGLLFVVLTSKLKSPSSNAAAIEETPPKIPMFKDVVFYFLAASIALYVAIEGSTVCWIAAYFEKHLDVTASSAAQRLSIFWWGIVTGRMLMVVLPSRWTLWPAAIISVLAMIAGSAILSIKLSPNIATVTVFLYGFAAGPVWPVIVGICRNLRNCPRFTSAIIAAGAIGMLLGPWLSSYVIRYLGMNYLFPTLTAATFLLLAVTLKAKISANR